MYLVDFANIHIKYMCSFLYFYFLRWGRIIFKKVLYWKQKEHLWNFSTILKINSCPGINHKFHIVGLTIFVPCASIKAWPSKYHTKVICLQGVLNLWGQLGQEFPLLREVVNCKAPSLCLAMRISAVPVVVDSIPHLLGNFFLLPTSKVSGKDRGCLRLAGKWLLQGEEGRSAQRRRIGDDDRGCKGMWKKC